MSYLIFKRFTIVWYFVLFGESGSLVRQGTFYDDGPNRNAHEQANFGFYFQIFTPISALFDVVNNFNFNLTICGFKFFKEAKTNESFCLTNSYLTFLFVSAQMLELLHTKFL